MKRISDLVLYKDHHLIAFNKPAGIPTHQDLTGDMHLHRMAMAYAHRDLYIVHRLDRRVSGVLVFAKTKAAAAALSAQWQAHTVKKVYLAIVPAADIPPSGRLQHYLTYDSQRNLTFTHDEPVPRSDEAILHYQVLQLLDNFMLLRIDLISGRKHQIRAQLAALGIPIRGDRKYGSKRRNRHDAIDLHAYKLQFQHPARPEKIDLTAPLPEEGLWEALGDGVICDL